MLKNRVVVIGWFLLALASTVATVLVLSRDAAVSPAWAQSTEGQQDGGRKP